MYVLPMYCAVPAEAKRGYQILWTGIKDHHVYVCAGKQTQVLQDWQDWPVVLIAEPSVQPLNCIF